VAALPAYLDADGNRCPTPSGTAGGEPNGRVAVGLLLPARKSAPEDSSTDARRLAIHLSERLATTMAPRVVAKDRPVSPAHRQPV